MADLGIKWINEILQKNSIKIIQKDQQDKLICLHLDLTLYQSNMLKNSTFENLKQLFNERKILIKELEEICALNIQKYEEE